MGLRKEKAAKLKLSVLDSTLKLIGKKPFDDLHVDEICAKVTLIGREIDAITLLAEVCRKSFLELPTVHLVDLSNARGEQALNGSLRCPRSNVGGDAPPRHPGQHS